FDVDVAVPGQTRHASLADRGLADAGAALVDVHQHRVAVGNPERLRVGALVSHDVEIDRFGNLLVDAAAHGFDGCLHRTRYRLDVAAIALIHRNVRRGDVAV